MTPLAGQGASAVVPGAKKASDRRRSWRHQMSYFVPGAPNKEVILYLVLQTGSYSVPVRQVALVVSPTVLCHGVLDRQRATSGYQRYCTRTFLK